MPAGYFRSHVLPWLIFSIGVLFYAYEYLLRIFPSLMIQELTQRFTVSGLQLGNLVALYYYSYTLMQIPVGLILDRFGPRRVLPVAAFSCVLGIYFFHSSSLYLAGFGRFLMGLGSAFAFVGTLDLARVWFPQRLFGFFAGITVMVGLLGAKYGNELLAYLNLIYSWTAVLIGLAVSGGIIVLLMLVLIRDKRKSRLASSEGYTFKPRELINNLLVLISNRQIWLNGMIGCLFYLPLSAFAELWAAPYLQTAYHMSVIDAASVSGNIFLGWAIGAPLIGWLASRINQWQKSISMAALLTGCLFIALIYGNFSSLLTLKLLFFALGLISSCQVLILLIANKLSSPKLAATTLALTNMIVMSGGIIIQPLIGYCLDKMRLVTGAYSTTAFQWALSVLPIACFIVALLCFWLKKVSSNQLSKPLTSVKTPRHCSFTSM
jgi:MFS family permease